MSKPGQFRRWFDRKWKLFSFFLAVAAAVAAVASVVTYSTVLRHSTENPVKIVVLAPLSGPNQALGASIRDGAALFAAKENADPKFLRDIEIVTVDASDAAAAKAALENAAHDPAVLAVLGNYDSGAAGLAAVHRDLQLPGIGFASAAPADASGTPWLFNLTADTSFETKFLANYVRNVVGEKLVSIVYPAGSDGETLTETFDQTLQKFGTKVLYKFPVDFSAGPSALQALVASFNNQKPVGTIVILGEPAEAAAVFATLRQNGIKNAIVGTHALATTAFRSALAERWSGAGSVGAALNGTLVTTPMLFDTAGAAAQAFRSAYGEAYGTTPDWLAAASYDAISLFADAVQSVDAEGQMQAVQLRQQVRDRLAAWNAPARSFNGLSGPIFFGGNGATSLPTLVGVYNGADLIAGLTQLSPIREEGVGNYLQELVAGRALYVNDRFMYKTNVVYSGIRLEKIAALDKAANTADIQFTIWFRWSGNFEPQDVVFPNAVKPIVLQTPDKQGVADGLNYRAYRVRGTFFLNYSDVPHAYGKEIVGVEFHNRTLARNNVMYVDDLLGMGLGSVAVSDAPRPGAVAAPMPWYRRLFARLYPENSDPLLAQLKQGQVLAGLLGWVSDRAWISQELLNYGTDGDPNFVGFGRPSPEFSTLDMATELKPDSFDLLAFFPHNVVVYIAIFALAAAILASMLDRKDRGQFWRMQTLLLRVVAWPVLLLTVGSLVLDYAAQNWTPSAIDTVVMIYYALWWLAPARLLTVTIQRFVWVPLENRTRRKVPNVIRHIVIVAIYVFAGFGIVSFVLDRPITSLLATSGLLTLIIGLAVQSNLRDVLSGIVLNIERPFGIGDDIRIGTLTGKVMDITWRTTRIRSSDGQLVSFPNGRMSDSEIHNFTRGEYQTRKVDIWLDPKYDPRGVLEIVRRAIDKVVVELANGDAPKVAQTFTGIEWVGGNWAAHYLVEFQGTDLALQKKLVTALWERLWPMLQEQGIAWERPAADIETAWRPQRALPQPGE